MGEQRREETEAGVYAPSNNSRVRSAAELYREASAEQAKAMRMLAGQLRAALDAIPAKDVSPMSAVVTALVNVAGVERSLLSIAAELERAGET